MTDNDPQYGWTGEYRPSPLAPVERIAQQDRWVLIFTREFGHPIRRVWEALTEPGQLRQWAPYVPDRDLAASGEALLTMQNGDDDEAGPELKGTVLQCHPPRLLVHAWGNDELRWELERTDDGTTLVLRQTFSDESMTSALAAGWHLCFDVSDALMKDVPFGPVTGRKALDYGWADLNQRYAQVLDVKPTSIG